MSQTIKFIYVYSCYLSACLSDTIRSMLLRSGMEWGYYEPAKSYRNTQKYRISYRNRVEVFLEAVRDFQEGEGEPASETKTVCEILLRLQGHKQVRKGI